MHQRARLDVTAGLADGPAVLAHGVPGADPADRNLVTARNQLTDVNAVAARFARIVETDTFARLQLAQGDGDIVRRINQVNEMAQCSILLGKPVSFKGSEHLLSSPW